VPPITAPIKAARITLQPIAFIPYRGSARRQRATAGSWLFMIRRYAMARLA
jgi:hypothetical protein